jgi:hypothetical protein
VGVDNGAVPLGGRETLFVGLGSPPVHRWRKFDTLNSADLGKGLGTITNGASAALLVRVIASNRRAGRGFSIVPMDWSVLIKHN